MSTKKELQLLLNLENKYMNIPLNGRIAIIDDVIEQAEPLMQVLSKNQLPYVFYKGNDLNYLPDENSRYNDIRLLFLDINLLDEKAAIKDKQTKSILINVLKRIISPDNFPYSIILWSRHEQEHSKLVEALFENELKDIKPINIKGFVKSDFFPNFSDELVENDIDLIDEIKKLINSEPAYSYIINWENQVHLSADKTLQEIFSSYHSFKNWQNNANYILNKMGNAYLGKHFDESSAYLKIQSSFVSFSSVFKDTLEHKIFNTEIEPNDLIYNNDDINSKTNKIINEKLNISRDINDICEPGNVITFEIKDELFKNMLFRLISIFKLKNVLKQKDKDITETLLKKEVKKEAKRIRDEIKENCKKIALVVTPVCDYAQKNNKIYDRLVKGILIPYKFKKYIEDKSEAVYILPITITFEKEEYSIIIDFRYFITTDLENDDVKVLFRVRQQLLAEVQSKLARHINRQGVLFLD